MKKSFYYDRDTIAVSSKERDDFVIKELQRRGKKVIILDIATADYQAYGLPGGVRVERKKDFSELIKSLSGKPRYYTEKECRRAHADGTPLYYVIGEKKGNVSGVDVSDISDLQHLRRSDLRDVNQHESIQDAIEHMHDLEVRYGVKFVFVAHEEVVDTILDLLEKQPGTVYEGRERKPTKEELIAILDRIERQESEYDQIE